MNRRPRWPLQKIRSLASLERLVLTHAACDFFPSRTAALDWIHGAIAELRTTDFAHSVELDIHSADVYGIVVDGCGWYLKLTLEADSAGDLVLVISCHPLEHPLSTQRGTIEP